MERKPHIILSSLDLERIEALLDKQPAFPGREALEAELDRADVLEPKEMPPNVVTMNSTVRFTLLESGKTNTLTLVYPKEMDGSADKVSVFAPGGVAIRGGRSSSVMGRHGSRASPALLRVPTCAPLGFARQWDNRGHASQTASRRLRRTGQAHPDFRTPGRRRGVTLFP